MKTRKRQQAPREKKLCPCGKLVPFPPEALAGPSSHRFWSVVHDAQWEYKRGPLDYKRELCRECDTDAVLEIIRGDMKLNEPIMKLAGGLSLIADGYEGPFVILKIGKEQIGLSNSNIKELREALNKAEIWNEFGDAPGMAL